VSHTTDFLQSLSDDNEVETANLVNALILDAVAASASDIHIEPWESTLVVRLRVLGVLTELVHLPLDFMDKVSGRLKVIANLVSYQSDLPQEGHAAASP